MQQRALVVAVTALHGGGAEAVGVAWANWLASSGHQVTLIALSDASGSAVLRDDVDVVDVGGLSHRKKVAEIAAVARKQDADAVLALQTYPNLLALAAAGRRAPWATLVSEHNLVSLGLPGSPRSHRVKISLAKASYRRADQVIACSHPVAAEMVAAFGVRRGRYSVVVNPALGAAHPMRLARAAGGARIDVVLAGRLAVQKRPVVGVDVVSILREQGLDGRLVIIGTGPLRDDVHDAAKKAAVPVVDHGWLQDWTEALTAESVLLLASSREGLGNVLVEAAARGIPSVAASTALGVADAIVPGVTGVLAADDSPVSLAAAVREAGALSMTEVPAWLDRFSADASGSALNDAIDKAVRVRSAR